MPWSIETARSAGCGGEAKIFTASPREGSGAVQAGAFLLSRHAFALDAPDLEQALLDHSPITVLSGRGLVLVFVGARFVITDVLLARFVERLTEGHPDREHAVRRSKALVFYIFGVYCACCVFLAYDAMLDRSAVSTYRSEAIGVTRSHKVCVRVADALGRGL